MEEEMIATWSLVRANAVLFVIPVSMIGLLVVDVREIYEKANLWTSPLNAAEKIRTKKRILTTKASRTHVSHVQVVFSN